MVQRPHKQQRMPDKVEPQLATLAAAPPSGEWLYEIKFDGYRILARIEGGQVRLFTRNGFDWTTRMPVLARSLAGIPAQSAWIDGEVVMQDDNGRPDFEALQSSFSSRRTDNLVYYAFDLVYLDGEDLSDWPIEQRRGKLGQLIQIELANVRFSETFDVPPQSMLKSACEMNLEGLMGKRKGSRYRSGRTNEWVKLKCTKRQEFVIAGYTHATGGTGMGSLILGLPDDRSQIHYAGRVQSGFSDKTLSKLRDVLDGLESAVSPLIDPPPSLKRDQLTWVRPVRVCEVKYAEITSTGKVRHASFIGLREDKNADEVRLEKPMLLDSN